MAFFKLRFSGLGWAALASVACLTCVRADIRQWQVGGDGLSWRNQELNSAAVSFESSGAIQLVSINPDLNIVQQLGWGEGFPQDFIAEQAQARVWDNVPFKQSNLPLVDGDPTTSSENRFKELGFLQNGRAFFFDLGTRFPANRIVFFPRPEGVDSRGRPFNEDFIRGYKLQVNDGVRFSPENLPIYSLLTQVDFTSESVAETRFPLQFVRYVQLNVSSSNPFEIAEFQVYGLGFPPQGKYLSAIVDLGEPANFSKLTWNLEKLRQTEEGLTVEPEAASRVSVRMRTGRDETPQVFYEIVNVFTRDRNEVSESDYNRLNDNVRGPVEDDQANWSEWSAPFTESGQQIQLPSPRRYFQFEVTMESQAILDGIRLNSLQVEHTIPPLAQLLIAEISVLEDPRPPGNKPSVTAGGVSTFAYDIQTDIGANDVGFDGIEIFTPSRPEFIDLLIGNPPVSTQPDSIAEGPNSLKLFFPSQRFTRQSPSDLRIVFKSQVFVQATFFNAEAFDTQSGEAPQRVLPGDANPSVFSNNLRVLTSASSARDILRFFDVEPRAFTPNGDRINDQATVSFTLVQLKEPVEVTLEIFDLGGRKVKTLFVGERGNGAYTWSWDGRDDGGALLPHGVYLVKVEVDTDRRRFERLGTIGLVY